MIKSLSALVVVAVALGLPAHAASKELGDDPPRCTYSEDNADSERFLLKGKFCPQIRFFDPTVRVYFDTGTDDPGEVDIFNDGSLSPTIQAFSLYFANSWGNAAKAGWTWGIDLGAGLTSPASDSADSSVEASDSPVVVISAGLKAEFPMGQKNSFGIEVGKATGFSADESLMDNDDTATYAGLFFNFKVN